MLTGRKPDLSRMGVFGSECYAHNHDHKKLDSRCTKGVFVGYDKNRTVLITVKGFVEYHKYMQRP